MNIKITDNYRLVTKDINLVVQRKHTVDPTKSPKWKEGMSTEIREEWRDLSYHSNVPSALRWFLDHRVRESEATTIEQLLNELQSFRHEIEAVWTFK